MKIINLTPHAIKLPNKTIEPSGKVARCEEITHPVTIIDGIEIVSKEYGEVQDLPEWALGMVYIVSFMVRDALPDRKDLLSPGDLIRNDKGEIIGCSNLVQNI
jgi:hypothetical protein